MKRWFYFLLVIAVGGLAVLWQQGWFAKGNGGEDLVYRTAKISKGDIQMAVSTTGKVRPVTTVEVGSQISGQISEMLADFNTPVRAGQIIARLDPASYTTRVEAAQAELSVAYAGVAVQMATLEELKADADGAVAALRDAEQELQRVMALYDKRVVAQSNVDRSLSARDQARAKHAATLARQKKQKAQLLNANAQVLVRKATLKERQLDLDRTVITSPIDGVVTGRNVDLGQTVAASLQAPVLFSIAGDLGHMQLEVSVDEADIGSVVEGQKVNFTVDAFARRKFAGDVLQVRKAPTEVANVVTYTVIVQAENPDHLLLPGMTANVDIIVGARTSILRVPEAALRFKPNDKARSTGAGAASGGGPKAARARAIAMIKNLSKQLNLSDAQRESVGTIFRETGMAIRGLRDGGMSPDQLPDAVRNLRSQASRRIAGLLNPEQVKKYRLILAEASAGDRRRVQVWIKKSDGGLETVNLVVGISDGSNAEIIRGKIKEDTDVIVGASVRSK
jgi:HlyD family secretion protein